MKELSPAILAANNLLCHCGEGVIVYKNPNWRSEVIYQKNPEGNYILADRCKAAIMWAIFDANGRLPTGAKQQ